MLLDVHHLHEDILWLLVLPHAPLLRLEASYPIPPRPNDGGQRAGGVTVVRVVGRVGGAVRCGAVRCGAVRSGERVGRFWE